MSVLVVHPEDSPVEGPWAQRGWDFVLDLGWAGTVAYAEWERRLGCPVRGFYGYAKGPEDFRRIGAAVSAGRGILVDECGLDWWEMLAPLRLTDLLQLAIAKRAVREWSAGELTATRRHPVAALLAKVSRRGIRYWQAGGGSGVRERLGRIRTAARRMTPAQLLQATLDKWDMGYRLRGRMARRGRVGAEGAVLLPSAYANVTRILHAYARCVPEQEFLLVTTRRGGRMSGLAGNVRMAALAGYADGATAASTRREARMLERAWDVLDQGPLRESEDLAAAWENGSFQEIGTSFEGWLRIRDAWKKVIEEERISGVLCGDENNATNRIPVLLAAQRNLPTVHCDHGALNVLLPLRSPACDTYLVKGAMEREYLARTSSIPASRVVEGAPGLVFAAKPGDATAEGAEKGKIVFFSEQLELTMGRTRILYEELLPRLCALARTHNTRVVIRLHPFESRNQRREFVDAVVPLAERELVEMIEGPLTEELLGNTWFGLTVESSVAVDCAIRGIACFLCQWFATPVTGYDQQYVRYGAARELASPEDVARIPEMLEGFHIAPEVQRGLWNPIAPGKLKEILRKP